MKTSFYTIALLVFVNVKTYSQDVDYNTIILPSSITDVAIHEKLVQLAWENFPANQEAQKVIEIAQHKVKIANLDWFNLVKVNMNFNEFNIDASNVRNQFYPKYNLGIQIPIGAFVEIPQNIKIAKNELEISKLRVNQTKLMLRANVLERYQTYLSTKELYNIQKEAETDSYSNYLLIEQKFKAGDVHVSAYVQASKNYNDERKKTVIGENRYKLSIIALEELIGIKLSDVH